MTYMTPSIINAIKNLQRENNNKEHRHKKEAINCMLSGAAISERLPKSGGVPFPRGSLITSSPQLLQYPCDAMTGFPKSEPSQRAKNQKEAVILFTAKPPKSYSVDSVTFYVLEVCLTLKRGKMRLYLKKQKLPKNVIVNVCVRFLPACCLYTMYVPGALRGQKRSPSSSSSSFF